MGLPCCKDIIKHVIFYQLSMKTFESGSPDIPFGKFIPDIHHDILSFFLLFSFWQNVSIMKFLKAVHTHFSFIMYANVCRQN